MSLPAVFFALRWLVRDTFRQAWAVGVSGVMILVTVVCTMTCLGISIAGEPSHIPLRPWEDPSILPAVEAAKLDPKTVAGSGADVPGGEMTLYFGAVRIPLSRTRVEAVRFVQVLLAGGVADTFGVLLALIWTAGFLPAFLDPSAASVLVAKPLPRWALLTGRFVGVMAFVLAQAVLFVGLTWVALGTGTGVWDARYLLCVPILLFHFILFFSVSAFMAVVTRSTVASVVGALAAWLLCWSVNYGRYAAAAVAGDATSLVNVPVEWAYWLLPKPGDLSLMLVDAVQAGNYLARVPVLKLAQERGLLLPEASVLTSCLVPAILLIAAGRRFARADY